uniref:Uncharacterized protein n=1 Tax=Magallana gigas TaxID=29159 RepID=K1QFK4_MAGGI
MSQKNEVFSGRSVEEYDQIPADKMFSESQIQTLKNRVGSEGDYESREHHSWEDHTYQGLKETKGTTKDAFSEYYNQIDD